MKVAVITSNEKFLTEIIEVVKIFEPNAEITHGEDAEFTLSVFHSVTGSKLKCVASFGTFIHETESVFSMETFKRDVKLSAYMCLKKHFRLQPPWGALTGIRPTKLARDLHEAGRLDEFQNLYDVTDEKFQIAKNVIRSQENYRNESEKTVDFYVGIPFCISRCTYCSFTGGEFGKLKHLVQPFVDSLSREIVAANEILRLNDCEVGNIYVGGGTPATLECFQLEQILKLLSPYRYELTVEVGRADAVTADKLRVLSDFDVKRISLNPQTFNDEILKAVNRTHTSEEFIKSYEIASKFNWQINMDLIAGLPGESVEMFSRSVEAAIKLKPHNLTVHTLALKAGSKLKEICKVDDNGQQMSMMVDYARLAADAAGYMPYYLYRQKYVSGNLENVGYCLPGMQCRYNINIMEELSSIMACGCNAVSKRIFGKANKIIRQGNPKDVLTYINGVDKLIERKRELFF